MTLILGLVSDESVVVASDSQFTDASYRYRRDGQKVWANREAGFVFGAWGNEVTIQEWERVLVADQTVIRDLTRNQLREALETVSSQVLGAQYGQARRVLGDTIATANLPLSGIVLGTYAQDGPVLLSVHADGTVEDATDRALIAAGSGSQFAEHAFAVFRKIDPRTLKADRAEVLAYRITEDAITASGSSLGSPVQMARIPEEGHASVLEPEFLDLTRDQVETWRRLEAERFMAGAPDVEMLDE